jgi:phosphoketolase
MTNRVEFNKLHQIKERAALYRKQNPVFARWAAGYGVIMHEDITQVHIYKMADLLRLRGVVQTAEEAFNILAAADRVTNAAMWLVAHMTYAQHVYLDGRDMEPGDFKPSPEGHTGGALNIVPAYVGYLAINSITGMTRSWLMGQGHCVAAIDATNLIVDNMTNAHAKRYKLSDEGLSRFVQDFYSYRVRADGRPESPLGSHVNPYTAGGMLEGGYLGFAELYYAHMPLPGERLVAFLSDGAFEEQRGSDWVPRWWRGEDCGLIAPLMIANGRRIDQRSTMSQVGGVEWFRKHLRINGFDPLNINGRDPASFACGVFEMEERLTSYYEAVKAGEAEYPAPIPYGIANTIKGYGFPGAGTNFAHNLPLGTNPAQDMQALQNFNLGARDLWVPHTELKQAIKTLSNHAKPKRPKEKDHPLAWRKVSVPELPKPPWRTPDMKASVFPMDGLDAYFCSILQANPELRPRVGNPDEMRSNRMNATLDLLKHRVTAPEVGIAEAVDGSVITALNEEAVVCAALANKGGINIAVSYEAFAVKMLGAIRQEIIFARHQNEAGAKPKWLSIPIVVSSHAWENGKNELSHQDPTLCETLMGEMSDVSRVVFPADWNTAIAMLQSVYSTHGQIWTLVMPKRAHPIFFDSKQSQTLIKNGALNVDEYDGNQARVILAAIGSYQLMEALRAGKRLGEKGISHRVVYIIEPGRFRSPRDEHEAEMMASSEMFNQLFPDAVQARIFLAHMRPETLQGVIRPLDTGVRRQIIWHT